MFDGKVGKELKSNANRGFSSRPGLNTKKTTAEILLEAKKQKELREKEKQRQQACLKIQTKYRQYFIQKQIQTQYIHMFESKCQDIDRLLTVMSSQGKVFLIPNQVLSELMRICICFMQPNSKPNTSVTYQKQLLTLLKYLLPSIESTSYEKSFFSIGLSQVFSPISSNNTHTYRLTRYLSILLDTFPCNEEILQSINRILLQSTLKQTNVLLFWSIVFYLTPSLCRYYHQSMNSSASLTSKTPSSMEIDSTTSSKQLSITSKDILLTLLQASVSSDFIASLPSSLSIQQIIEKNMFAIHLELLSHELICQDTMLFPHLQRLCSSIPSNIMINWSIFLTSIATNWSFQHQLTWLCNVLFLYEEKLWVQLEDMTSLGSVWVYSLNKLLSQVDFPLLLLLKQFELTSTSLDQIDWDIIMNLTTKTMDELQSEYDLMNSLTKFDYRLAILQYYHTKEQYIKYQLELSSLQTCFQPLLNYLIEHCLDLFQLFFHFSSSNSSKFTNSTSESSMLFWNQNHLLHIYALLLLNCPLEIDLQLSSQQFTSLKASSIKSKILNMCVQPIQPFLLTQWYYPWFKEHYITPWFQSILVSFDEKTLLQQEKLVSFWSNSPYNSLSTPSITTSSTSLSSSMMAYEYCLHQWTMFNLIFDKQCQLLDDDELFVQQYLFSLNELQEITSLYKRWLYKVYWTDPMYPLQTHFLYPSIELQTNRNLFMNKLICLSTSTACFVHLCIRNERRSFLTLEHYQWPLFQPNDFVLIDPTHENYAVNNDTMEQTESITDTSLIAGKEVGLMVKNPLLQIVLTNIPHVIPFNQRVHLFQSLIEQDRVNYFSSNQNNAHIASFNMATGVHSSQVRIRRDHILEDAYSQLSPLGSKLKGRIQIEFISEQGYQEAGIDGGGLFKEFMDSFAKSISSTNPPMFIPTSEQLLTPNPNYDNFTAYQFIGKILGKSLYEKILFESEFALGFLNILLGRLNTYDDLYHLDIQLYRSLQHLKDMLHSHTDIANLDLYFSITRQKIDSITSTQTMIHEELVPHGSNLKVTNNNAWKYIQLYSNHLQNQIVRQSTHAFLKGFAEMIPLPWIRIFTTKELQRLISGERCRINIQDLLQHTSYSGGYHESQDYVRWIWDIINEMNEEDQSNLLKFVTSCPRQPLLGFGQLTPKFCIQKTNDYHLQSSVLLGSEAYRLPSAATCMNLLKLPQYPTKDILREKLLYAIRSNSGFELS